MEKCIVLLFAVSFFKECIASFVYLSKQNAQSCVVGLGGLMNIIMMIGLPILLILSITIMDAVWWKALLSVLAGFVCARIIEYLPFINMLFWMLSYIALPTSVVLVIIEIVNMC